MEESNIREIAFFGKITAGVTHELKNVLAIIGESGGLMEDLIQMSKENAFPHADRMHRALETIREQIQRGVDLTTRLNRFAHDPDQAIRAIDLNETITNLAALSHRFARLKNVALTVKTSPEPIPIESRSVMLQMVLFTCIECCLQLIPPGGRITVAPEKKDGKKRIRICCRAENIGDCDFSIRLRQGEKWLLLEEWVSSLGGSFLQEDSCAVVIALPDSIST